MNAAMNANDNAAMDANANDNAAMDANANDSQGQDEQNVVDDYSNNSHKPYIENFGYGKSPLIHPHAPSHHDYLK